MKSMGEVPANPGGRVEERGESCWLTHYKQVNPGVMLTLVLPSSSLLRFGYSSPAAPRKGFTTLEKHVVQDPMFEFNKVCHSFSPFCCVTPDHGEHSGCDVNVPDNNRSS